jgi:MSHA pilin protein MshA
MMKKLKGFTLVELIIVLVVIAIIAVLAIPRFIHQTSNARIAALNGLVGAINSAALLTSAQYHAGINLSNGNVPSISANGKTITVMSGTGFPTATETGIGNLLPSFSGFSTTYQGNHASYSFTLPIKDCNVIYNATSGQATANSSGC